MDHVLSQNWSCGEEAWTKSALTVSLASTHGPMARCKDFCHEVDPERQDPGATHAGRWPVSLRFDNWVTWNHWFCLLQECHTLKRACVWWIATLRPAITITTKNVRILGGIECPTFGQVPYTHTCSEISYRITDVECIKRAQTIQYSLTGEIGWSIVRFSSRYAFYVLALKKVLMQQNSK